MTDRSVDDVVKRIVMAHHDDAMKAVATIFINEDSQPEMDIAFGGKYVYHILAALEIMKHNLLKMLDDAVIPPKDRR
jgi:hypothetical protein